MPWCPRLGVAFKIIKMKKEKKLDLIIEGVGLFKANKEGVYERKEVDENGDIHHSTYHIEADESGGDVHKFIKTIIY